MSDDFYIDATQVKKLGNAFSTHAYDLASYIRTFRGKTDGETIHDGFGFLSESEDLLVVGPQWTAVCVVAVEDAALVRPHPPVPRPRSGLGRTRRFSQVEWSRVGVSRGSALLARGDQVGYPEGQSRSILVIGGEEVRDISTRYGIIEAQALTPQESLPFIEKSPGEL